MDFTVWPCDVTRLWPNCMLKLRCWSSDSHGSTGRKYVNKIRFAYTESRLRPILFHADFLIMVTREICLPEQLMNQATLHNVIVNGTGNIGNSQPCAPT